MTRLAASNRLFDWQASNPYARFLEYNCALLGQRFLDIAKVREQQTHLLFQTTLRSASEEDYGRLSCFAQSEQSAKVSVG
jgi:hypothetical protein